MALGITSSEEEEEESTDQVTPLIYIAGTDISFVKNNETNACAAIVVVKLPSFEVFAFKQLLLVFSWNE